MHPIEESPAETAEMEMERVLEAEVGAAVNLA
jgi:hypothetical protein